MKNKVRYSIDPGSEGLKDETGQVETPEPLHERLYGLSMEPKHSKFEKTYTFHPEINRNSAQIIGLMQDGDDYDKQGRWESLYRYGTEKQNTRRELAKMIDGIWDSENAANYSFRPQINEMGRETDGADVIERTKTWAAHIEAKKQAKMLEYLENNDNSDNEETTFKPYLIAEEKLKE